MSTPFKMNGFSGFGNSPVKQKTGSDKQLEQITKRNSAKAKSKPSWDIKGYLKGEQGLVPDYKGESTKKTVKTILDVTLAIVIIHLFFEMYKHLFLSNVRAHKQKQLHNSDNWLIQRSCMKKISYQF